MIVLTLRIKMEIRLGLDNSGKIIPKSDDLTRVKNIE